MPDKWYILWLAAPYITHNSQENCQLVVMHRESNQHKVKSKPHVKQACSASIVGTHIFFEKQILLESHIELSTSYNSSLQLTWYFILQLSQKTLATHCMSVGQNTSYLSSRALIPNLYCEVYTNILHLTSIIYLQTEYFSYFEHILMTVSD